MNPLVLARGGNPLNLASEEVCFDYGAGDGWDHARVLCNAKGEWFRFGIARFTDKQVEVDIAVQRRLARLQDLEIQRTKDG